MATKSPSGLRRFLVVGWIFRFLNRNCRGGLEGVANSDFDQFKIDVEVDRSAIGFP